LNDPNIYKDKHPTIKKNTKSPAVASKQSRGRTSSSEQSLDDTQSSSSASIGSSKSKANSATTPKPTQTQPSTSASTQEANKKKSSKRHSTLETLTNIATTGVDKIKKGVDKVINKLKSKK
jgi:hypothetical protein